MTEKLLGIRNFQKKISISMSKVEKNSEQKRQKASKKKMSREENPS